MYTSSLLQLRPMVKFTFYKHKMKIHWNGIFLRESKSQLPFDIQNYKLGWFLAPPKEFSFSHNFLTIYHRLILIQLFEFPSLWCFLDLYHIYSKVFVMKIDCIIHLMRLTVTKPKTFPLNSIEVCCTNVYWSVVYITKVFVPSFAITR